MKKVIRLTESDLMRLVKRVVKESQPKRKINEGIGTALLVLTGVGVIYLGRQLKKFMNKAAQFLPTASLGMFVKTIEKIENETIEGKVVVEQRDNFITIMIIREGEVFDSLTLDMDNNEIFSGHGVAKGKKPDWTDRIVPMTLPKDADDDMVEELEKIQNALVDNILTIVDKYSKPISK